MQPNVFDLYNNEIAYYKTPKCGSRTILGWAALIKDPNLITENPDWFSISRKNIEYPEIRKKVIKYELLTHDQKIRFCIVRDPVDRFISTFTNRILYHKKPNIDITITDFIKNYDSLIERLEFRDAKFHFITQTHRIGTNPSLYTHIFNIKELYKVKELLEINTKIKLPNLHLNQNGDINKPILTTDEIEWIKDRYHVDYEIYGKWLL